MMILGGSASQQTAKTLAEQLQQPLASIVYKRFPDDECYIRIEDTIKDEDVVIVQTTYPDEKIIELFLIQDAVKEAGAKSITVVIPYFGYSRQDTKFKDGEPISARILAQLIGKNADTIITIDPHKQHILDFFKTPAQSCTAINQIASYLKNQNIDFILAPDKGALERVKQASSIINCPYDYMEKTRIDGATVEIKPKKNEVKGKQVAILDDIISTGGTMALSIQHLKKQGAKKVLVACTHGLFAGNAIEKLQAAGCDDIIATDTIQNPYAKVSTAPCIISCLKKIKSIHA